MWCECTSVVILSGAQSHPRRVTRRRRPTTKGSLQFSPSRPIAALLSERRAYRSGVSVFDADIADQRSSKLEAGSSFASAGRPLAVPAGTTIPSGECDLMVAAVAATASRATAANPVIVRCLVIRTSCGPERPLVWVTGTSRRFNSNATSMDCANPQTDNEAVPNSKSLLRLGLGHVPTNSKWSANVCVGAHFRLRSDIA
jgi:hypothetical protein